MERDDDPSFKATVMVNFNSHAHVERDKICRSLVNGLLISTHTLTWSVTGYTLFVVIMRVDFNSHAHVERD